MLHEDLEFWRGAFIDASLLNGLLSAAPLGSAMAVSAYVAAAYGPPPHPKAEVAHLNFHRKPAAEEVTARAA